MIQTQILNGIQCAISHNCAKAKDATIECAHCEIDYKFIACEPMTLKCGHHVCKRCQDKLSPETKCMICGQEANSTVASGVAADVLLFTFINPLFLELREKYKKAFDLYSGK